MMTSVESEQQSYMKIGNEKNEAMLAALTDREEVKTCFSKWMVDSPSAASDDEIDTAIQAAFGQFEDGCVATEGVKTSYRVDFSKKRGWVLRSGLYLQSKILVEDSFFRELVRDVLSIPYPEESIEEEVVETEIEASAVTPSLEKQTEDDSTDVEDLKVVPPEKVELLTETWGIVGKSYLDKNHFVVGDNKTPEDVKEAIAANPGKPEYVVFLQSRAGGSDEKYINKFADLMLEGLFNPSSSASYPKAITTFYREGNNVSKVIYFADGIKRNKGVLKAGLPLHKFPFVSSVGTYEDAVYESLLANVSHDFEVERRDPKTIEHAFVRLLVLPNSKLEGKPYTAIAKMVNLAGTASARIYRAVVSGKYDDLPLTEQDIEIAKERDVDEIVKAALLSSDNKGKSQNAIAKELDVSAGKVTKVKQNLADDLNLTEEEKEILNQDEVEVTTEDGSTRTMKRGNIGKKKKAKTEVEPYTGPLQVGDRVRHAKHGDRVFDIQNTKTNLVVGKLCAEIVSADSEELKRVYPLDDLIPVSSAEEGEYAILRRQVQDYPSGIIARIESLNEGDAIAILVDENQKRFTSPFRDYGVIRLTDDEKAPWEAPKESQAEAEKIHSLLDELTESDRAPEEYMDALVAYSEDGREAYGRVLGFSQGDTVVGRSEVISDGEVLISPSEITKGINDENEVARSLSDVRLCELAQHNPAKVEASAEATLKAHEKLLLASKAIRDAIAQLEATNDMPEMTKRRIITTLEAGLQ